METVAARLATGFRVENSGGNDVLAKEQYQPVNRPYKLGAARTPAHPLRDRQGIERGLDNPRQQTRGWRAGLAAFEQQEFALAFLDPAKRRDRRATGLCKCGRRACRLATGIEGRIDRRSASALRLGRLCLRESADQYREASRCCVRLERRESNARGAEPAANPFCKRGLEFAQGQRRQFLGTEFHQQIAGAHALLPAAPSRSIGKPSASRLS